MAKNRRMRRAFQKLQDSLKADAVVRKAVICEVLVQQLEYTVTKAKKQVLLEKYQWPESVFEQRAYSTEMKAAIADQVRTMPEADMMMLFLDLYLVGWHTSEYDYHIPKLAEQLGLDCGNARCGSSGG